MGENILLITLSITSLAAIAWVFQFVMRPRTRKAELTLEQAEELKRLEDKIKDENSKGAI